MMWNAQILSVVGTALVASATTCCHAFSPPIPSSVAKSPTIRRQRWTTPQLYYSERDKQYLNSDDNNDNDDDDDDTHDSSSSNKASFSDRDRTALDTRVTALRLDLLEREYAQPPHPRLSPLQVVDALVKGLVNDSQTNDHAGVRTLLRASTPEWRQQLYAAVGAKVVDGTAAAAADRTLSKPTSTPSNQTSKQPKSTPSKSSTQSFSHDPAWMDAQVASALGDAMGRPHNQFAILVGADDNDENSHGSNSESSLSSSFVTCFPSDLVDHADGTCWVECQFRSRSKENTLLVTTGWDLELNEGGAWVVAGLDWQDFRDEFRPGIGREEWMRICG